ncbi:MFS transporter [Alteromonas sp. MB-3u-76]|uniref:MFS transporter n=1 Tax=unclassified Alteromonas TaxID=2614992 RepID=UPI0009033FCF|nr:MULTISPECIES: MFS transporter [unclassified Alteromonas]APE04539.1 MFS transporter [Alteromonas sp. RW2A1]AUC86967.1 MFS transporter [Alteromonas sp. MB-3u-76]
MNALELRAALALASVYVLRMLGLFMVMPVLAVAAMDYPDYSPLLVGLAVGGYGLTQAALQIPMGMMSDKWGRKPVILLGLSVFAIGSFVAANADTMAWMIVGRILQGAGAIAGAIMALATDVSRESQRAKVLAIIGIAIGFSFYIAVIVGPLIANRFGLSGVFAVTGLLAILCIPLVKWVVPNSEPLSSGETLPQKGQLGQLILSKQLWRLNVSVLILHMLITLLFVQLPVTLTDFDMSLSEHWRMYLPVLGASIVGLIIMMGAARGRTPKSLLLLGAVFMGSAFFALGISSANWWLTTAAVILFFTGFNYLEANFPALVSSIAPAGQKGTAMGIYASFQFFGAFLGGMISGVVTDVWSPNTAYMVGAASTLLWLYIISGIKEVSRVKRVMMNVENPDASAQNTLKEQLLTVPGVLEVTFNTQSDAVYLKVDRDFDAIKARAVIRPI